VGSAVAGGGHVEGDAPQRRHAGAHAPIDDLRGAVLGEAGGLVRVGLATATDARPGAHGDGAGRVGLVAVAEASAGTVGGHCGIEHVAHRRGVTPGSEATEVVSGVADVVEALEADEGGAVASRADAVTAPRLGDEGAHEDLVEVDVDAGVEAHETRCRAADGLVVDDPLALGVHTAGDADVDRDPAGGEAVDLDVRVVDAGLEGAIVGGQDAVGLDPGSGLGVDGGEVAGHAVEGEVDGLVPSGVAHLDGRDATLDAVETAVVDHVRREAGLGLGLVGLDQDAGGAVDVALAHAGAPGGAGGAGAAAEVLELLGRHDLTAVGLLPAVAEDHRPVDEDVGELVAVRDHEATIDEVDGAGHGGGAGAGGAGIELVDEDLARGSAAAVLVRDEPLPLGVGDREGVRGRGVAVVVDAVADHLVQPLVAGGVGVVAVDIAGVAGRSCGRGADEGRVAVAVGVHQAGEARPVGAGERGGGEGGEADEGEGEDGTHGRAPDGRVFRTPSPGV